MENNKIIIIPKEEPKPFKDMQQLTEVDWEKFKKKPFTSKKEPKQGTMSEAIKQVINNQLKKNKMNNVFIKEVIEGELIEVGQITVRNIIAISVMPKENPKRQNQP
jgi:hypothetical protein